MNKIGLKEPVELYVAADESMLLIIRLTTAGVVARAGLTVDEMENLKIAAEEACSCLIGQQNPPRRLRLIFGCADGQLSIEAEACDVEETPAGLADETELEIIRCLLESLADHAEFHTTNGWIRRVALQKKLD